MNLATQGAEEVLVVEEGYCRPCSDDKTKKALAKVARKTARDPRSRTVKPGQMTREKKQAIKLLEARNKKPICQRRVLIKTRGVAPTKRKCGKTEEQHPAGKAKGCCGFLAISPAELRAQIKQEKLDAREAKRAAKAQALEMKKYKARVKKSHQEREARIERKKAERAAKKEAKRVAKEKQKAAIRFQRLKTKAIITVSKSRNNPKMMEKLMSKSKKAAEKKPTKSSSKKGKKNKVSHPTLKVGTILQHQKRGGKLIEAKVVKDGVSFKGKIYKSISGAAKAAAEAHGLGGSQNGYVFWTAK